MDNIYKVINYLSENLEIFKPIGEELEHKDKEIKDLKERQTKMQKAIDDLMMMGDE